MWMKWYSRSSMKTCDGSHLVEEVQSQGKSVTSMLWVKGWKPLWRQVIAVTLFKKSSPMGSTFMMWVKGKKPLHKHVMAVALLTESSPKRSLPCWCGWMGIIPCADRWWLPPCWRSPVPREVYLADVGEWVESPVQTGDGCHPVEGV